MFWASRHGEASRQIQSHAMLLSVLADRHRSPHDPHGPYRPQRPHDSHRPHDLISLILLIDHQAHLILMETTRWQQDLMYLIELIVLIAVILNRKRNEWQRWRWSALLEGAVGVILKPCWSHLGASRGHLETILGSSATCAWCFERHGWHAEESRWMQSHAMLLSVLATKMVIKHRPWAGV